MKAWRDRAIVHLASKVFIHLALFLLVIVLKIPLFLYLIILLIMNRITPSFGVPVIKIGVGLLFVSLICGYLYGGDWLMSSVSDSYTGHYPESISPVYSGGDSLAISIDPQTSMRIHVCFYTIEGLAVAAGHATGVAEGLYQVRMNDAIPVTVRVTSDGSSGIVIEGLDKPKHSRQVNIAIPEDIEVQEVGVIEAGEQKIPVLIAGFTRFQGEWHLMIRPINADDRLGKGLSGSPLYQGDKLVGLFTSAYTFPYRGPTVGLAKLAFDVYEKAIANR